jgi:hypothetical protein
MPAALHLALELRGDDLHGEVRLASVRIASHRLMAGVL